MARILIVAVGSRGDALPYLDLGRRLSQAGHAVTVQTHRAFEPAVATAGLRFAPIAGDPQAIVATPTGEKWINGGRNFVSLATDLRQLIVPLIEESFADCMAAAENADILLPSRLAVIPARAIAARLTIPVIPALLQPAAPTSTFASIYSPAAIKLPGAVNYMSHWIGEKIFARVYREALLRLAGPFGLPRSAMRFGLKEMTDFSLLGVSRAIVSPASYPDGNVAVTGYWFPPMADGWTPPEPLVRFLAAGPAPVCVGFGSMRRADGANRIVRLVSALHRRGARVVLLGGWSGVTHMELPDDCYYAPEVPHEWLFPQMAAIVHHGGAGTTAAALRAGRPALIMPFFADQHFWAERLRSLGLGPPPCSLDMDTGAAADAVIAAVRDAGFAARLADVRTAISAEDGPGEGVRAIEHHLEYVRSARGRVTG